MYRCVDSLILTAFLEYALSSASVLASTKSRRRFGKLEGCDCKRRIKAVTLVLYSYHVDSFRRVVVVSIDKVSGVFLRVRSIYMRCTCISKEMLMLARACELRGFPNFHQVHLMDRSRRYIISFQYPYPLPSHPLTIWLAWYN